MATRKKAIIQKVKVTQEQATTSSSILSQFIGSLRHHL